MVDVGGSVCELDPDADDEPETVARAESDAELLGDDELVAAGEGSEEPVPVADPNDDLDAVASAE